MKEYEIYVPLRHNDGTPIEAHKVTRVGELLLAHFDGMTFFPQRNQGYWKMGQVTFRDEIVIFRVLAADVRSSRRFLRMLKERLRRELRQEEMLIVEKDAKVL